MLRVRPVPLRHAMSCGCAVILCSVSVCLSVCATLPPFVGLQLGNTTSDRPEAWPMMRESCKVTRKQVHLNNFEYAGGKNKHTHTHTHTHAIASKEKITWIIQPGIAEAHGFPTVHMQVCQVCAHV